MAKKKVKKKVEVEKKVVSAESELLHENIRATSEIDRIVYVMGQRLDRIVANLSTAKRITKDM